MPKELVDAFHAIIDPQGIGGLLLFVLPGFVAFKFDQQLRPQAVRSAVDSLLEIIVYSIVNDLLWSPVYDFSKSGVFPKDIGHWLLAIVVLIVSPAALTLIYTRVVDALAGRGIVPSPVPKPWDHFFQRVVKDYAREVGVILTLRDGRRIGGIYKQPGFASSFPTDEQLLLAETWILDTEGGFSQPVVGSLGLLIDKADILTLEFFKWPIVPENKSE